MLSPRNIISALLLCLGMTGLTTACKPTPPSSASKSTEGECDCRHLECWRKKSNKASAENFSCAANALSLAAAPASALAILADIASLAQEPLQVTLANQRMDVTLMNLLSTSQFATADLIGFLNTATPEKNPGIFCITQTSRMFGQFLSSATYLFSKFGKENDFSPTFYQKLKGIFSGANDLAKMTQAFGACIAAIEQDPALSGAAQSQLSAMNKALNRVIFPIQQVFAIMDCGFAITAGGNVLLGNSICLAKDFKILADSQRDLAAQRQRVLDLPMPNQPDESTPDNLRCNLQPDSCNVAAYRKFGIWLGQQTYIGYATRSGLCSDMCGNNGRGSAEAKLYQDNIFGDDAVNCMAAINTAQQCDGPANDPASIVICISHCCNQENSCANAARNKLAQ